MVRWIRAPFSPVQCTELQIAVRIARVPVSSYTRKYVVTPDGPVHDWSWRSNEDFVR